MNDLGTLLPVNVRQVWKNEASEFTPWLAEHAGLLGDALGLKLEHAKTEAGVGRYSADLVFREEDTDRLVVVENMLEPTDHDHLGKLITYAAGLGARYAVLIAPEYRDEHRSALNWLNSISAEDFAFFGVVLETWRIGDSQRAPHLRVDVKPDSWSRFVKRVGGTPETSERRLEYQRFWSEFLPALRAMHVDWPNTRAPALDNWMDFGSGRTGFKIVASFCRHEGEKRLRVEMYIDGGDKEANKESFDRLRRDSEEIEQTVGDSLSWDRLDDRKASRISLYYADPIDVAETDRWPAATEWLIDAMGRMRSAFRGKLDAA